jgi:hypothetical protein
MPRGSDQPRDSSVAHAKVVPAIAILAKLICSITFLQYDPLERPRAGGPGAVNLWGGLLTGIWGGGRSGERRVYPGRAQLFPVLCSRDTEPGPVPWRGASRERAAKLLRASRLPASHGFRAPGQSPLRQLRLVRAYAMSSDTSLPAQLNDVKEEHECGYEYGQPAYDDKQEEAVHKPSIQASTFRSRLVWSVFSEGFPPTRRCRQAETSSSHRPVDQDLSAPPGARKQHRRDQPCPHRTRRRFCRWLLYIGPNRLSNRAREASRKAPENPGGKPLKAQRLWARH